MTRRSWLAAGLAAVALGLVTLVTGAVLVALRDGGYPWHAGLGSTVGGQSTASVTLEDGTTTSFTGGAAETQAWLDAEQARLRDAYGITTRTETGEVLRVVGVVLLVAGVVASAAAWRARPAVPA